jgi:hypothetical protein
MGKGVGSNEGSDNFMGAALAEVKNIEDERWLRDGDILPRCGPVHSSGWL